MNYQTAMQKGSTFLIVTLIIIFAVLSVLFIPLTHYRKDGSTYAGPSFIASILGEKSDGVPITEVYSKNFTQRVESPFNLTCQSDLDCQTIVVKNQCKSYCANLEAENESSKEKLERNRVCDPAGYPNTQLNCKCILGSCTDL